MLKAVQSFYVDSRACVRVGNDASEWFQVNVGLRQGCVMSPWLFNVYMDGVVREVNVMVLWKGLELPSKNGCRFEINHLLFADNTALVADSEEKLCRLVSEFGRVYERRKMRLRRLRSVKNEGVIVPTALYGAEACGMKSAVRWKANDLEMKCLRSFIGVPRMDRVRNE